MFPGQLQVRETQTSEGCLQLVEENVFPAFKIHFWKVTSAMDDGHEPVLALRLAHLSEFNN